MSNLQERLLGDRSEWWDPEIDNPEFHSPPKNGHQNGSKLELVPMYQRRMESIFRQVQDEGGTKKDKKESQGYTPMSVSDIELIASIAKISDFDFQHPSNEQITPGVNEIKGALRGIEGHFLDALVIDLMRHNLNHARQNSLASSLPPRLFKDHGNLAVHESKVLDCILEQVSNKYLRYRLIDIPYVVHDIKVLWRHHLAFLKKKSPRAVRSELVEGWAYGAEEMRSFWNSEEQRNFGNKILEAHENVIKNHLTAGVLSIPDLPLETDIDSVLEVERSMTYQVNFPYCKIQFRLSADYVLIRRVKEGQAALVFDSKFGRWEEDTTSQRLQRLVYSAAIGEYLRRHKRNSHPTGDLEDLDPNRVGFYYRTFDARSSNYTYQDGSLNEAEIDSLKSELAQWVTHWWWGKKDYERLKKLRQTAAVMPYIPQKPIGNDIQKFLF